MTTNRALPPRMPHETAFHLQDTQPVGPVRPRGPSPWLIRIPLLLFTGLVLLAILGAVYVAAHQSQYQGRIFPGVAALGQNLGGLNAEEAAALLDAQFSYDEQAVFTFRDGERTWDVAAGALGVSFDVEATVAQAMQQGRSADLLANLLDQTDIWFDGRAIAPTIRYDQRVAEQFLHGIAQEINRPTQDATIVLRGVDVVTLPALTGRNLDVAATLALLRERIVALAQGGEIALVINETPPTVYSTAEAEGSLRAALSAPLSLYAEASAGAAAGPWVAAPETLAGMLVIERVNHADGSASYAVHLDPAQLVSFLNGIAPDLLTAPVPARFHFNDETRQLETIQAHVDGRELDVEQSLAAIEAALFTPSADGSARQVPLAFRFVPPAAHSGATADELGIHALIAEATTYYLGSTEGRKQNIAEAAARFNGVIIASQAEFSFNEWLGDVSLEAGFEEALIILNGRTITGVGGGVCQVSTTAFQAAFYAGFPILERLPHGYRVSYYEYGEGVGMDATIYSPLVDFRFLNDTDAYLLIETETDSEAATVTFRFYSTDVGREVVKVGPRVENEEPPGPVVYEENAELLSGQRRQVEWAVSGAEVTVTRQVFRNGQLESEDHFFSQYIPWSAVIQVAPGEIPPEAGATTGGTTDTGSFTDLLQ